GHGTQQVCSAIKHGRLLDGYKNCPYKRKGTIYD
ncbi:MAG: hypothetical protein ACI910_003073, partial [Oleispira sp.]